MEQPSLFDSLPTSTLGKCVTRRFHPSTGAFLEAALIALAEQLEPSQLWWVADREQPPYQKSPTMNAQLHPESSPFTALSSTTQATFREITQWVTCYRADDRWTLLYDLLWRLTHGEPQLFDCHSDETIRRTRRYEQAVRRDYHKMKAFTRFKRVSQDDATRYVAWFEPAHLILPLVAQFFARRFTQMQWSVLTPDGCAHWQPGHDLSFSPGLEFEVTLSDDLDQLWKTYYQSIFNPARLKVKAMTTEMPKKYWRHLPEADLIHDLVQGAAKRVDNMLSTKAMAPTLRCGKRPTDHDK